MRTLTVLGLACLMSGCGSSTIHFLSTSGSPNGALTTDGFSTNYSGFVTSTDSVNVGNQGGNGEVVGFSQYRPAHVQAVSWSGGTVDVNLGDQIRVPISFWVLSTPFNTNSQRADAFWFRASDVSATARPTG
ncbi:MAG TPA: hypothetical protein VGF24_24950 [Vicinamibacterales bacterium]|jgi:hypothetical protein